MTRRLVILNPWAGRGVAGRQRAGLEQRLRAAGFAFDIVATQTPKHATLLALQAVEQGYEQVVAVGGDGTLNEVVNGIMRSRGRSSKRVTLGMVPLGTASDFVKSLNGFIHNNIEHAIHRLAAAHIRHIDVGQVTLTDSTQAQSVHFFLNGLGMGIDACIGAAANTYKYLRGKAAYLVGVVRALAVYRANSMMVRADEHEYKRRLLVATVANGRCQGGGFWLTPEAVLDDGMLDLCLIDALRIDQIVRHFPSLLTGTHTRLPFVTMGRAAHITVDCAMPTLVAADGEVIATDTQRIDIRTMARKLDIII